MKIKLLETSLNLRIEREKNIEYKHFAEVGKKQKAQDVHIIANVEDMNCEAGEYKKCLEDYNAIEALDDWQGRGVSCYVIKTLEAEKVSSFSKPHFLHVRLNVKDDNGENKKINLIIFRILVSNQSEDDFKSRKKQFDKVMKYIDDLDGKENLILTGDWNHGVINDSGIYRKDSPRYFYNYQYIEKALEQRGITLVSIDGYSYKVSDNFYLKIDHLAVSGSDIKEVKADYVDLFKDQCRQIGIPDHKCIYAEFEMGTSKNRFEK